MHPSLENFPMPIKTDRLVIRPVEEGDQKALNESVVESQHSLAAWVPWAKEAPSLEETRKLIKQNQSNWILKSDVFLLIFDKASGMHLGCTGFHRLDWKARVFETGYWLRDSALGKGIMTEAIAATTRYAFDELNLNRLEIRCDCLNVKSRAIPNRLGYEEEAILKKHTLANDGESIRDTAIYARFDSEGLPNINAKW